MRVITLLRGQGDDMPRWIAIGNAPGWDDIERFSDEMRGSSNWRPDARTAVTTVLALADGRMLAECHGVRQEDFEAWLQERGWSVESITAITHVAKTGSVWEVG